MEALESYSEAGFLPSLGHLRLCDLGHSISFLCASICELYGMGIIYLFYSVGMIVRSCEVLRRAPSTQCGHSGCDEKTSHCFRGF